jgi:hypothetical protein
MKELVAAAALMALVACDWTATGLPSCEGARGPFYISESFAPTLLEDPSAVPLVVRLRAGDRVRLFVADTFFERAPPPGGCDLVDALDNPLRVTWRTTNPGVAVAEGDGSNSGHLRAVGPGEARIFADVSAGGAPQRAELHYWCCGGSCPVLPPTCRRIPIDRVVVYP